jgi:hypothetical protein
MAATYLGEFANRAVSVPLLVVLVAAPLRAQRGALTRPRNLGQLVEQAAVIIRGNVIGTRVEPHPELTRLTTVVVTLRVRETLKGEAGPIFTFRQYIWDIRDHYDALGYRKGQELLLLMNRPTRYGLSSPTGLEQGRFRILRDAEGREIAVNGHGNAGLFRDLEPQLKRRRIGVPPQLAATIIQERAGPVPVGDLEDLIRHLAIVSPR